jgi:hypothetical protein
VVVVFNKKTKRSSASTRTCAACHEPVSRMNCRTKGQTFHGRIVLLFLLAIVWASSDVLRKCELGEGGGAG